MKDLDIIIFRGVDFVSKTIQRLQSQFLRKEKAFSHVALVISTKIVDHPNMVPDKFYIWESTMSGKLSDGVLNIDGKSFFGAQVRDLDLVVNAYKKAGGDASLISINLKKTPSKRRFQKIFNKYNGANYDMNFISLLSSLYPKLRCIRGKIEKYLHTDNWLFCSELCAIAYKEMKIIPNLNTKNVVPEDFVGTSDADKQIPNGMFEAPVPL